VNQQPPISNPLEASNDLVVDEWIPTQFDIQFLPW
jgi:hypothetical protein